MNSITELVLIESRSARTSHLSNLSDERALETLNKAKALVMAVWQGTGIATNAQLAEFYEVSEEAVQQAYHRNREELTQNGVKVLKGKELKLVVDKLSTTGTRIRSSLAGVDSSRFPSCSKSAISRSRYRRISKPSSKTEDA